MKMEASFSLSLRGQYLLKAMAKEEHFSAVCLGSERCACLMFRTKPGDGLHRGYLKQVCSKFSTENLLDI